MKEPKTKKIRNKNKQEEMKELNEKSCDSKCISNKLFKKDR